MPGQPQLTRLNVETLTHIQTPIHLLFSTQSSWAVLLVKFSDDPAGNPDLTIYEKLFTSAGAVTDNMLAFSPTCRTDVWTFLGAEYSAGTRCPRDARITSAMSIRNRQGS